MPLSLSGAPWAAVAAGLSKGIDCSSILST